MSFKKVLLLLGTAAILTGCYHAATTPQAQPTPVPQQQQSVAPAEESTVTYTDQGFSPVSITVKAGNTVTFVNQGSKSMWVASSSHPTHQDLPGLNQLKGGSQGTTYSYTFDKVGQWKYHNHLSPTHTGTVVVE